LRKKEDGCPGAYKLTFRLSIWRDNFISANTKFPARRKLGQAWVDSIFGMRV